MWSNGTPLSSRVVHGMTGHLSSCMWNLRFLWTMHGGVSAPWCCAFIHRVTFREVTGHRDLINSGPGKRGLSACGTTHEATSRISSSGWPHPEVRRDGREPLPDKAGESTLLSRSGGEKGLREVVPGTSVFPSRETGMSGNFWVASSVPSTVSNFKMECAPSLDTL